MLPGKFESIRWSAFCRIHRPFYDQSVISLFPSLVGTCRCPILFVLFDGHGSGRTCIHVCKSVREIKIPSNTNIACMITPTKYFHQAWAPRRSVFRRWILFPHAFCFDGFCCICSAQCEFPRSRTFLRSHCTCTHGRCEKGVVVSLPYRKYARLQSPSLPDVHSGSCRPRTYCRCKWIL